MMVKIQIFLVLMLNPIYRLEQVQQTRPNSGRVYKQSSSRRSRRQDLKKDAKDQKDKSPKEEEIPVNWSYEKQDEWPSVCVKGHHQSPIKFEGVKQQAPDEFKFDLVPNQKPIKTKFELKEGSLIAKGEFMTFSTDKLDQETLTTIRRYYKNKRIEIKIPCEHESASACDMEIQFYCEEQIDYTMQLPTEKISNLAFAIFFSVPDTAKDKYFFDAFKAKQGEKIEPFFKMLKNKHYDIKPDQEIEFNMMEALDNIGVLPQSLGEPGGKQVHHYAGSFTKPKCDENLYWFVLDDNDVFVPQEIINFFKDNFLKTKPEIFPQLTNNRKLQTNPIDFLMVSIPFNTLNGMTQKKPLFVKKEYKSDDLIANSDTKLPSGKKWPDTYVQKKKDKAQDEKDKELEFADQQMEMASKSEKYGVVLFTLNNQILKVTHYRSQYNYQKQLPIDILLKATDSLYFAGDKDRKKVVQFKIDDKSFKMLVTDIGEEYVAYDFSEEDKGKVDLFAYSNKEGQVKAKFLGDDQTKNPIELKNQDTDISVIRWSAKNEQLILGTESGKVLIYQFLENHQLAKQEPEEVQVFDGKKVLDLIYQEPILIAIDDSGSMNFKNLKQDCPDDPTMTNIIIDTEDQMKAIEQINDSLFISISDKKLRLWDFRMKKLIISHEYEPEYNYVQRFGHVYKILEEKEDEDEEEDGAKKEEEKPKEEEPQRDEQVVRDRRRLSNRFMNEHLNENQNDIKKLVNKQLKSIIQKNKTFQNSLALKKF